MLSMWVGMWQPNFQWHCIGKPSPYCRSREKRPRSSALQKLSHFENGQDARERFDVWTLRSAILRNGPVAKLHTSRLPQFVEGDGDDDEGADNYFLHIGGPVHVLGAGAEDGHG